MVEAGFLLPAGLCHSGAAIVRMDHARDET